MAHNPPAAWAPLGDKVLDEQMIASSDDPVREKLLNCLRELSRDSSISDFSHTYAAIQRALVNADGARDFELEAAFTDLRLAVVARLVQTLSGAQPAPHAAHVRREADARSVIAILPGHDSM